LLPDGFHQPFTHFLRTVIGEDGGPAIERHPVVTRAASVLFERRALLLQLLSELAVFHVLPVLL
jgi:hypothetical protein